MSLVNDMLRDLDARQVVEDRDPDLLQPALGSSRGYGRSYGRSIVGGAAAVLLLAGFIVSFWVLRQPQADVPEATPAPAVDSQSLQPAISSVPGSVAEAAPVIAEEAVGDENGVATAGAVDQLLAAADRALAEDRLTQPPVDNAYTLYSHVLLLQPDNARAHHGVSRVRARYEQLVREAVQVQAWPQARLYLQRAAAVGMSADRLAALRAQVAEPVKVQTAASVENSQAVTSAAPALEPSAEVHEASIEESWPSREADAVAQANRLLRQGRQREATENLQAVVAGYAKAESAALLLFDIHMRSGQIDQARALQTQVESPALKRYFNAKLLSEAGQRPQALALLERGEPSGAVVEPWLALQAALYQQAGAPEQAMALYQRLVQMNSRQAHYWLGLGIAAEAAGQPEQALRAFVAAHQLPPVNAAASNYVRQRIEALSP